MKQIIILLIAFSMSAVFTNCTGRQKQVKAECNEDSIAVQQKKFIFTEKGLENIEFGKPFPDSTAVVEELYNRVEVKRSFDEIGLYYRLYYNFYLNDALVIYAEADDATKKIQTISVISDKVELENGIRPGMPIHNLMEQYGLTIEYSKGEEEDMLSTCWNGFYIYFTSDQLTEKGLKKAAVLDDYGTMTLTAEDVSDNVCISTLSH